MEENRRVCLELTSPAGAIHSAKSRAFEITVYDDRVAAQRAT